MAGVQAEAGLTDALLADVGTEPGNLALMEHALAQLWDDQPGKYITSRLTNWRYEEIGRLKGAIGKHARAVYLNLTPDQQPWPAGCSWNWCIWAKARRTRDDVSRRIGC